jgi:uncharacterized protein (DUF1778 family)
MPSRAVRNEKLCLRLRSSDKRTLEAAASVSSLSLSDFVRESALPRAAEMLAGRRTFVLSKAKWSKLQSALDAPTLPRPRMQRLLTEPGFFDASTPSTTREEC